MGKNGVVYQGFGKSFVTVSVTPNGADPFTLSIADESSVLNGTCVFFLDPAEQIPGSYDIYYYDGE